MVQEAIKITEDLMNATAADQRAKAAATAAYNLRVAEEQRLRKQAEKEWDRMADSVTLSTLNTQGAGMGILGEDVTDGISAANPRRYVSPILY